MREEVTRGMLRCVPVRITRCLRPRATAQIEDLMSVVDESASYADAAEKATSTNLVLRSENSELVRYAHWGRRGKSLGAPARRRGAAHAGDGVPVPRGHCRDVRGSRAGGARSCHGAAVVQHVCVWWVQHAKYEFTLLTRLRGLEDELARERTRCAELAAALHKAAGATARFRALAQAGFCGGLRARALAVGSDVCRGARVSGRGWRHWRLRRPRRWTPRGTAQSSRTRWMRVSARFCPDCVW